MKNTRKPRKPVPAEAIAGLADQGKDVSRFFTNTGKMMGPIQRVNVDLASGMLEELDRAAKELNISRQAVIKTLIRQALDQQYLQEGSAPRFGVGTTTEIDASVEFYDLKTHSGIIVQLPGSGGNQIFSGADVEFDPVHKLFLVAQPVSSTEQGVSSIQVYDTKGNLVESLNGFNFSNASSVIPVHIALNPAHRSGFVDDPAGIRSFTC